MILKKKPLLIFIHLFLVFVLFFANAQLNKITLKPFINISKQNSALNVKKDFILLFNFGLKRLISSLLWVETMLESDIEHYKKKDLNSWIYLRFDTLTNIDPLFFLPYFYGGRYLSIIKNDTLGAAKIYEKGLKKFPNHFWLHFHAGFNYYYELGNCERAYQIYKKIAYHPLAKKHAPYLPSILARLKTCTGNLNDALSILTNSLNNTEPNSILAKHYKKNIYSIRAEIDLKCLNNNEINCNKFDYFNNEYIIDKIGRYTAKNSWKKYRLKERP